MRSEYQSASDRNRAALQAQLLGQGFGQAQAAAQQAFMNQQTLGQQQLGLGSAQQGFLGQDVGALSTLGAQNQALAQAQLSADQQLAQAQLQQPLQAAQALGAGITGLIAGYPGQTQQQISPSPSLAQTALGTGATLAGIYRGFGLGQ
jgi:S-adenosylmethionine synthetase